MSIAPAFALSLGVSASASASTSVSGANAAARLQKVITQANSDIAARITALNNLNARVQAMVKESASEKASISADVQTNISGLQTLQTKIDADTTVSAATTDAKTIFTTFRIYALVMPQGYILAAADRVTVITGLMSNLATQIQTRITADQSAGKNVSALTATLADMNASITDANNQSATAQAGVSGLQPDQGNATVAASNKAALVAARGDIKTATSDLQAARKDITTLLQGLKSLGGGSASASTSASVSTQ
jgi:hypothetical protein